MLAKEPPTKLRAAGGGAMPNTTFVIPPGDPNYEVTAQQTIDRDTYLTTLYPHMHVRGKDMTYTLIYPDGREEVLLQRAEVRLQLAAHLRAGRAEVHAEGIDAEGRRALRQLDGNRFNPDPTADVKWGDQTWEEMLIGYFGTIEVGGNAAPAGRRSGGQ